MRAVVVRVLEMIFRVYEEGCGSEEKTIDVPNGTPNARAIAAAKFCASDNYKYQGISPVNVIVCPVDAAARALPGWKPGDEDDPDPYVCLVVAPKRTIVWTASQVHGFNPYGTLGKTHGPVADGERHEEVSR